MRIEITSKNYKPNGNLKELLEKKINKFDKYFHKEPSAKVVLSMTGNSKYTMEIMIVSDTLKVRSEVTSTNMFDNIDIVLPKIERQIVKYRKRFESKLKKEAFETPLIYDTNENVAQHDEEQKKSGKLVKEKSFEIAMTDVDNAIEEMELLDHNFYIFLNADTEKISVVYKRYDGNYGLLSPEY